jgi:hypothetical protein
MYVKHQIVTLGDFIYIISDYPIVPNDKVINLSTFVVHSDVTEREIEFMASSNSDWRTIIASNRQDIGVPTFSRKFSEKFMKQMNISEPITEVYVKYVCDFISNKAIDSIGKNINLNWIICGESTIPNNYYVKALNETSDWILNFYGNGFIYGTDFTIHPLLKDNGEVSLKSTKIKKDVPIPMNTNDIKNLLYDFADKVDDSYRMYTSNNIRAWEMVERYIKEKF